MSDHGKLDASERVHSFLVHRHAELLRRLGPERVPPLRIDPPIAEEEAAVCRSTKASYFWAVCPGRRDAFRIEPTSSSVRLSKIETLPSAEYGTV